jgi:folate-binding protein YgfZ
MGMKELREFPRNAGGSNRDPGLAALRADAAIVERTGRGILRLTGKDPVGMLNAILTNNVPPDADPGAYALLLNPKGRMQSDLRVLRSGTDVLIDTEPEGADAAREILGRYAPFSRVKLEDLSDAWSVLGFYGPGAGDLLDGLVLAEHGTAEVEIGGETLLAAGVAAPVPGYDLLGPSEAVARAADHLAALGAVPAGPDAYEAARVGAGVPRFGADLTPENFPGEAGVLDRAVDFGKGCYPGQETVARMRYRGHPNKTLYRLSCTGEAPAPGTTILQGEKRVGTVTSVSPVPENGEIPALGYLSRNTDLDAPIAAAGSGVRVLGEIS